MDNRTIDVVSEGTKDLEMALSIIWNNCPGRKATHYKIVKLQKHVDYYGQPTNNHYVKFKENPEGVETLILLWHEENNAHALPHPLNIEEAIQFVTDWLEEVAYKDEPDHDGDNGKGWRVFTEQWGQVASHQYAIVGIQPSWSMYGK